MGLPGAAMGGRGEETTCTYSTGAAKRCRCHGPGSRRCTPKRSIRGVVIPARDGGLVARQS